MVVVALVVGGSVVFGLRVSASSTKALRERVATTNAGLRTLATRLGLAFTEKAPYHHPMVGDTPCYATVEGTHHGHPVRIEVANDEDADPIVVTVTADAALPWPNLGRLSPSRDRDRHPQLTPALAELDPRASEIRVTPTALHVVPKTPRGGAYEEGDLVAAVGAAVALAKALDRSAL